MATILHFATICGILCLMHGGFANKDTHKVPDKQEESTIKYKAKSEPLRGKAHIKNLKSSDENILINSDSSLRGRTIHQTAWSEEEKENSISSENFPSSANEKDIMQPENLKKFLKYVMKVVHKLEEQEKQELKKAASYNRESTITVTKDNPEIDTEETLEIFQKNKTKKSGSVQKNADIEELFSEKTQDYLSTFFQSSIDSKTMDNDDSGIHTNANVEKEDSEVHEESDSSIEVVEESSTSANSKNKNHSAGQAKSQNVSQMKSSKDTKETFEKVTGDILINKNIKDKTLKTKEIDKINLQKNEKKIPSIILKKPNEIGNKEEILETKKVTGSKLKKYQYSTNEDKSNKSLEHPNITEIIKIEKNIKVDNNEIVADSNTIHKSQNENSEKNIVKILNGTKKENDTKDSTHFKIKKMDVPIPNQKIKLPQNVIVKNMNNKDEIKILTDSTKKSNLTMPSNVTKNAYLNNIHNNPAKLKFLKKNIQKLKEDKNSKRTDDATSDFKFSKQAKSHDINDNSKFISSKQEKIKSNEEMKNNDIFTNIVPQTLDIINVNKIGTSSSGFQKVPSLNIKNKYDSTQLNTFASIGENTKNQNKFENENLKIDHSESFVQNSNVVRSFSTDQIKNQEKDKNIIYGAFSDAVQNSISQNKFDTKNTNSGYTSQTEQLKSQNVLQSSGVTKNFLNEQKNQAENQNLIFGISDSTVKNSLNQDKIKNEKTNLGYVSHSELFNSHNLFQDSNVIQKFVNDETKNQREKQNNIYSVSGSTVENSINQNKFENKFENSGNAAHYEHFNSHNILRDSNMISNLANDETENQKEKQNNLYSVSGSTIGNIINQNKFENKYTNLGNAALSEHFNSQNLFQNSDTIQKISDDQTKSQTENQNFIYSASGSTIGSSVAQSKFENENSNIDFASHSEFYNSQNLIRNSNSMQNIATGQTNYQSENHDVIESASSGGYQKIVESDLQNDSKTSQLKNSQNVILASSVLESINNNKVLNNAANDNKEKFLKVSTSINSKSENSVDNTILKTNKVTNSYDYILTSNEFIDMNESFDTYDSEYADLSCEYDYEENNDEQEDNDLESKHSSQFSTSVSIQEEEIDEKTQKTYNTILEYLYKHSNNPFFVALKKKSEKFSRN